MRTIKAIIVGVVCLTAGAANAQWVVHDPGNLAQGIINTTKEIVETSATAQHTLDGIKETAKIFLDMGFYFGIGGVLTFKNAKKRKEAVEYIPMDRIVLETDCPYLAPEPNRGKRNSSLNIPYVIAAMAQIKRITEEEVRKAAWDNSLKLYRMDK